MSSVSTCTSTSTHLHFSVPSIDSTQRQPVCFGVTANCKDLCYSYDLHYTVSGERKHWTCQVP